jgi:peptidoglycan hydrolase-like protein with peptidoglycan-binding domain
MTRSARVSALAILLLPALSFAQNCVTITQSLALGESGAQVTALQNFFHSTYNEFTTAYVTGYFGPMTQAALQQWQKDHGIIANGTPATTGWGVTGPRTRAALACASDQIYVPTASATSAAAGADIVNVSRGSTGEAVRTLQAALIFNGLLTPDSATGFFGALTEAAVQLFQRTQGIVSSGSAQTTGYGAVGPRTWAALLASLSGAGNSASDHSSDDAADIVTASSAGDDASVETTDGEIITATGRSAAGAAASDTIDIAADLSAIDQSLSQLDADIYVQNDDDI